MQELRSKQLVSVWEAARLLSVSPWTIYSWTTRPGGRLRSHKLGRRRMIAMEDLEHLIEETRQMPPGREVQP
ncbi:MAG: helix-turn-helix domain-containing protein [Deltaproteobacteria bacterium]|nr:helix-turn-helix domain-containing protein [Deltaproteobacteria bacterium]